MSSKAIAPVPIERILKACPGLDAEKIELARIYAEANPARGRPHLGHEFPPRLRNHLRSPHSSPQESGMKFFIDQCLSPELTKLAQAKGYSEFSHVVWHGQRHRGRPISPCRPQRPAPDSQSSLGELFSNGAEMCQLFRHNRRDFAL